MANCSKAIEFSRELYRLCEMETEEDLRGGCSDDCPFNNGNGRHTCPFGRTTTQEDVDIVQKWSDEHPVQKGKTYADYIFDVLPNIGIIEPGLPVGCRKIMFEGKSANYPSYCIAANPDLGCFDCWNEEIPVEKQLHQYFCDTGIVITEEEDKKQ